MEWMTWDDFPNYEVSEEGDVRYIDSGKAVKTRLKGNMLYVALKDEWGKWHTVSLLRLMAEAFYGNQTKDEVPYFIDGNPWNIHIDNIAWGKKRIKAHEPKIDILRDKAVRIVETGEVFYNGRILAEQRGYKIRQLKRCLENPNLIYNGLHFELIDPIEAGFDY